MADKIVSVRRESLGQRIGKLEDMHVALMDRALKNALGLTP
jgi:mRNA-degrading endonuclease toxin of MazEF toxin-antitoxin module